MTTTTTTTKTTTMVTSQSPKVALSSTSLTGVSLYNKYLKYNAVVWLHEVLHNDNVK